MLIGVALPLGEFTMRQYTVYLVMMPFCFSFAGGFHEMVKDLDEVLYPETASGSPVGPVWEDK